MDTADINVTELTRANWHHLFTKVLARPIKMFLTESIVLFSCIYLSLIYAIFYLFFEAYPIIFEDMYGMTPGECGLMFIPSKSTSALVYGQGSLTACYSCRWRSSIVYRLPSLRQHIPACSGSRETLGPSRRVSTSATCFHRRAIIFGGDFLARLDGQSVDPLDRTGYRGYTSTLR